MNDIDKMIEEAQLTDKQKMFVLAYIGECNLNATKAAEKADYGSPRQAGADNLSKPHIKKIVNAYLDSIRDQGIANKAYRLSKLNKMMELVESELDEQGVVSTAYTNQGKEYKAFAKDRLATMQSLMEQAAKEVGDRDKRLQIDADVRVETTSAKDSLLSLLDED